MENKTDGASEMTDWWAGTVVLTFLPIVFSIIVSLVVFHSVDLGRMIGDGELILSAFSISVPTVISHYKDKEKRNSLLFYLQLLSTFLHVITYAAFKAGADNNFYVVFFVSLLCVAVSIYFSWKSESYLMGGKKP